MPRRLSIILVAVGLLAAGAGAGVALTRATHGPTIGEVCPAGIATASKNVRSLTLCLDRFEYRGKEIGADEARRLGDKPRTVDLLRGDGTTYVFDTVEEMSSALKASIKHLSRVELIHQEAVFRTCFDGPVTRDAHGLTTTLALAGNTARVWLPGGAPTRDAKWRAGFPGSSVGFAHLAVWTWDHAPTPEQDKTLRARVDDCDGDLPIARPANWSITQPGS